MVVAGTTAHETHPEGLRCPAAFPAIGTACQLSSAEPCSYLGDGPCSRTNPDRIALCLSGVWSSAAPAIACVDAGFDNHGVDCSRPLTMVDYCERLGRNCSPFSDTRDRYCNFTNAFLTMELQPNACGGQTLSSRVGNYFERFDYGPDEELRSVQTKDDVPADVCMRTEYTFGEPCGLLEMPKRACSDGWGDDGGI